MKFWVLVFSPQMYELVKKYKTIGVVDRVWHSFSEQLSIGDKFIAYISRTKCIDSVGSITSDAMYQTTEVFSDDALLFPCRREVSFLHKGLAMPENGVLKQFAPFSKIKTYPGNYLMLKGGFVQIAESAFASIVELALAYKLKS